MHRRTIGAHWSSSVKQIDERLASAWVLGAAVAVAIVPSRAALAATRTWTGGPTGLNTSWSDPGNWNPFGVPLAGEQVVIPGLAPFTDTVVVYDYAASIVNFASLTVNHNNLAGRFDTSVLHLNLNYLALSANQQYIGDSSAGGSRGRGRFEHTGGTNNASLLVLGRLASNVGAYNLGGPSVLEAGNVIVGDAGTGFFTHTGGIHNAGTITLGNAASTGTYTQSGGAVNVSNQLILANSTGASGTYNLSGGTLKVTNQLYIGAAGGDGAFHVSGGAQVTQLQFGDTGFSALGNAPAATGVASVSGLGSKWTTDKLIVGSSGTGTLSVHNQGALVCNGSAYIGFVGTGFGAVTVSGPGSTWHNTGGIWVGGTSGTGTQGGTGILTIEAGGKVTSGAATIGGSFFSTGTVDVGTAGGTASGGADATWMVTTEIVLGPLGSATLNINPGGTVSAASIHPAAGRVRLQGGTLDVETFKPIATGSGQFEWTSGTLQIGTFQNDLVNDAGTLAPGRAGIGTGFVDGSYTQRAGGTLQIEIAGPVQGDFTLQNDFLRVLGHSEIDGTLHLALVNGYVPQPRDWFPLLLDDGSRSGTFATISGYAIAPGQDFAVHYAPAAAIIARAGDWHDAQLRGIIHVPGARLDVTGNVQWSGTLIKRGTGSLVVDLAGGGTSTVSSTGALLDVQEGHAVLRNDVGGASSSASAAGLSVRVTGGGSLRMQSTQHLATLEVHDGRRATLAAGAGGTRTLRTTSIQLYASGQLDLADNKLVVAGGEVGTSDGTTYSGLSGLIQSGRNGGTWDGGGIITSMPDAQGTLTTLGIKSADSAGTFGGVSVSAGDVLIMYTYGGDANLDGLVSGDDYTAIDFAIAVPGASGWTNGDFNYDGLISGDDYTIIDFNIAAQGAPFPTVATTIRMTAIPEPSSCGFAGLVAASTLLARPRRHRRHGFTSSASRFTG